MGQKSVVGNIFILYILRIKGRRLDQARQRFAALGADDFEDAENRIKLKGTSYIKYNSITLKNNIDREELYLPSRSIRMLKAIQKLLKRLFVSKKIRIY